MRSRTSRVASTTRSIVMLIKPEERSRLPFAYHASTWGGSWSFRNSSTLNHDPKIRGLTSVCHGSLAHRSYAPIAKLERVCRSLGVTPHCLGIRICGEFENVANNLIRRDDGLEW